MKRPAAFLAAFAIFCASWVLYAVVTTPKHVMPPLKFGNASELKQTLFVPALQVPHEKGKNLVWCGSFQMAWNELIKKTGGKVELTGSPPEAAWLNERLFDETMIDSASAHAGAATTDAELQTLRSELRAKFGLNTPSSLLPEEMGENSLVAYSLLIKSLAFRKVLQVLKEPIQFQGTPVAGFGLEKGRTDFDNLSSQIAIHSYRGRNDFVLELVTQSKQDQLLVAKVPPGATLLQTVQSVLSRRKERAYDTPSNSEPVHIPKLDFQYTASFHSLQNRKIQNKTGLRNHEMQAALQSVRFKLDERGAELESRSAVVMVTALPQEPRTFIVDGPFLILMIRRDAPLPYFALWVSNPELLVGYAQEPSL
jgi:hypothetical protein